MEIKHYREVNYPTRIPFLNLNIKDAGIIGSMVLISFYLATVFIMFLRQIEAGVALGIIMLLIAVFLYIVTMRLNKKVIKVMGGATPKDGVLFRYLVYMFNSQIKRGR